MRYIDFHCDTLMMYYHGYEGQSLFDTSSVGRSVDFRRMKEAGAGAQFFATFLPPRERMDISDEEYRANLYEALTAELEKNKDIIALATDYSSYMENLKNGKMSAFMTFEDGRMIDGKMENLKKYRDMGYCLISLTWNGENCFGYPNSTDRELMNKGLKDFGKEAIEVMNELGIIIDVSHLNDGGFYDICDITKKPFVASHSCARALTPHPRNLTDDMIRKLADKGGFIGLNYNPPFLGKELSETRSLVSDMVRHIEHIVDLGGKEVIGLGSDWDGIQGELEIRDPLDLHKLNDALRARGWSEDDVELLFHDNAERVIRDITL